MAKRIHIKGNYHVDISKVKSVEFKKEKRFFVTKDTYEEFKQFIAEKYEYISHNNIVEKKLENMVKTIIGEEKTVQFITIISEGDHIDILYKIMDDDNMIAINEQYIELNLKGFRPKIGEPEVYYSIHHSYVDICHSFDEAKETILNYVI